MAWTSTTVDRDRFQTLFKVNHIRDNLNPLRIKMMKYFNWTRVGTIFTQDEVEVSVRITFDKVKHVIGCLYMLCAYLNIKGPFFTL